MTNEQEELIDDMIFDCATDAGFGVGFGSDGYSFFVGREVEVDVTEQLYAFTALMVVKLKLYKEPKTNPQ
jgi:hypothetical protein